MDNTWEQQEAPVSSVKFDLDADETKEEKPQDEKPVGSLILSPVFAEFSHEKMACFSTLEESTRQPLELSSMSVTVLQELCQETIGRCWVQY